ncbi:MAG: hypothetical protein JW809_10540 [Pirellulales bacterium]|nr:hypothetical protein [Pirellulales bacterium]
MAKRAEQGEAPAPSLLNVASAWPAAGEAADALREILGKYDVTDITPREFSEMLHELQKTGAVPEGILQELALIRVDLEQDGIDPDESLDLVAYYTDKLAARRKGDALGSILQQDEPSSSVLAERLEWMEKFALVHADPDVGLDTTA